MRTDEERLDWLEHNEAGVWPVLRTVRSPLTDGTWGYTNEQVMDGWQAGSLSNPCAETLREAIDNAMEDN
jgi:hypothetical protein